MALQAVRESVVTMPMFRSYHLQARRELACRLMSLPFYEHSPRGSQTYEPKNKRHARTYSPAPAPGPVSLG